MKKAFVKLLCLLLGLNVFTACYGPAPVERELLDEELAALQQQVEEPEEEGQELQEEEKGEE